MEIPLEPETEEREEVKESEESEPEPGKPKVLIAYTIKDGSGREANIEVWKVIVQKKRRVK